MADELTATGLSIDDLATRRAIKVARLRAAISPILDVSPSRAIGQLTDVLNEHDQQLAELLQEVYTGFDPGQNTGQSQDAVASITGTYRWAATHGSVILSVDLDAVTLLPAGSQAAVAGDPDNIWATTEDVTSVGAGVYTVPAQCVETGPIQALVGTITVIVTSVVGWNSVTNAADAVQGRGIEGHTALRLRRELEVAGGGSTSVDSIAAAVSQVDGVLESCCLENDRDVAVDGMPPHSVEQVYWDGGAAAAVPAEIAEAIFEEKAGGVQAFGAATATHTDSQGQDHVIGLTLAAEQVIDIVVNLLAGDGYVGDVIVAEAIVAWGLDDLHVGDDVYRSQVSEEVTELEGVVNVISILLAINPAAPGAADIPITQRQIATIAFGSITVNS